MSKLIAVDYATKKGEYTCKVYGEIDKEGNWHVDKVKMKRFKKEVKKVRPYFETKVVKVKKKKKKWTPDCCPCCGTKREAEKPLKGNWVNGENLDKIKFPCFCSYFDSGERYGEIDIVFFNGNKSFRLRELRQLQIEKVVYCVYHRHTLNSLIRDYDIHILKGKIIIYEEE